MAHTVSWKDAFRETVMGGRITPDTEFELTPLIFPMYPVVYPDSQGWIVVSADELSEIIFVSFDGSITKPEPRFEIKGGTYQDPLCNWYVDGVKAIFQNSSGDWCIFTGKESISIRTGVRVDSENRCSFLRGWPEHLWIKRGNDLVCLKTGSLAENYWLSHDPKYVFMGKAIRQIGTDNEVLVGPWRIDSNWNYVYCVDMRNPGKKFLKLKNIRSQVKSGILHEGKIYLLIQYCREGIWFLATQKNF